MIINIKGTDSKMLLACALRLIIFPAAVLLCHRDVPCTGELVSAGLLRRHYAGWCKDHANRGGGRHAVYTVEAEALSALRRRDRLF